MRWVWTQVPWVPAMATICSAESGTTWRWAISVVMVHQHLVGEVGVVAWAEVGELLGAEEQRHAGRASAAEEPRDAVGGHGAELVD
jgi:hypothetical protein